MYVCNMQFLDKNANICTIMGSPDQLTLRRLPVPPTDIFREDTDLLNKIMRDGETLPEFTHSGKLAIRLDPSHPHHVEPRAHKVIWFTDQSYEPSYETWDTFLDSKRTLASLDERIGINTHNIPGYMAYIMLGHGKIDKPPDHEPKCRLRGLASKVYPHLHEQYIPIPKTHPHDIHVRPGQDLWHSTLEAQSNLAMDLTLSCIAKQLANFGAPFTYTDSIGVTESKLTLTHNAFGFSSMSEALCTTYTLLHNSSIKSAWPQVIKNVADHPGNNLPGETKVRAGFQLNAMIIHPSSEMRARLNPSSNNNTWVLLASDGGFSFFVQDGITIDRNL